MKLEKYYLSKFQGPKLKTKTPKTRLNLEIVQTRGSGNPLNYWIQENGGGEHCALIPMYFEITGHLGGDAEDDIQMIQWPCQDFQCNPAQMSVFGFPYWIEMVYLHKICKSVKAIPWIDANINTKDKLKLIGFEQLVATGSLRF